MTNLVVIGAGGHAKVVADIVRLTARYAVVGFLDDITPERRGSRFADAPILGGLEQLDLLVRAGTRCAFVAVGDCQARLRLASRASDAGFDLPVLMHPRSVCAADASLGAGTVLSAGAIVNPGASIGANVIVNTAASVDHDCVIEDGVHLACGARLAGNVRVGRGSWVGIGAVVKERVRIGAGTIVGAGALVLGDLPDGVVAYGSPARVIDHASHNHPVGR